MGFCFCPGVGGAGGGGGGEINYSGCNRDRVPSLFPFFFVFSLFLQRCAFCFFFCCGGVCFLFLLGGFFFCAGGGGGGGGGGGEYTHLDLYMTSSPLLFPFLLVFDSLCKGLAY